MRSFWGSLVVIVVIAVADRAQKRTLRFSYCYHDHHGDHHCDHDHHYIIITTKLVVAVLARVLVDRRSKRLECIWWPFHLIRVTFVVSSSCQMCLWEAARSCSRFLERFASLFTICNRPTFCHKLSSADCADLFLFVFSPPLLLFVIIVFVIMIIVVFIVFPQEL